MCGESGADDLGRDHAPGGGKGYGPARRKVGVQGAVWLVDFTISLALGKREAKDGIAGFIESGLGIEINGKRQEQRQDQKKNE